MFGLHQARRELYMIYEIPPKQAGGRSATETEKRGQRVTYLQQTGLSTYKRAPSQHWRERRGWRNVPPSRSYQKVEKAGNEAEEK